MIYEPMRITDKTGQEIILRSAEISDAENLIRFLKITASETPYLIREPDEIALTLEQEQDFIRKMRNADREGMLVAELDGRHLGNCSLMSMGDYKRYRHRCSIAIALYQEYCGRGIGKMMLETILKIAKENGYEQAELEVVADNKQAIALYKKLGFEQHGYFPNNMRYENGSYADAYWMMKKLI